MIFEPRLVFCILWASQLLGFMLFADDFTPFELLTWAVVEVGIVAFLAGATLAGFLPLPGKLYNRVKTYDAASVRRFVNCALFIYLLAFLGAGFQLVSILSGEAPGPLSPPAIRQAIIQDFLGERKILQVMRVFYFGVGLCVYLLAFSTFLSRRVVGLILVVGLFSAIATSGRLYLLLFFIAAAALLYRQKVISLRTVALGGLGFVVLFFLGAVVLEKGGDDGSVLYQIGWNAKVYILSSLACFNNFVQTGDQQVLDGLLMPNFVRDAIDFAFGTELYPKPDLHPFAKVPLQCNTYTVLFQLYHDGGLLLIFLGLFLIGAFQRFVYRYHLLSSSRLSWYVFALSLYPLAMSIFEDAYFSSAGFWLILWTPPVLHALFNFVLVPRRRTGSAQRA